MRHRFINNKLFTSQFFTCWMCGFLLAVVTPALADNESSQYSMQKIAEQSNPWALPKEPKNQPGFQRQPYNPQPYDYGQRYQPVPGERQNQPVQNQGNTSQQQPTHQWQPQTGRFVSPRVLESLKQQQQHYQVMPENQRYQQPVPQQYVPARPESRSPGQGTYGYPSYGTNPVNPLYDAPGVSPWGNGADVLYRGESFPMVPSEALGGFPPMHVPSFGVNNYTGNESGEAEEYKVFNPFTFLPK